MNEFLFHSINHLGSFLPGQVWAFLSYLGDGLTAFVLILPFTRKHPRLLVTAFVAVLVGLLVTHSIKYITHIPRPMAVLADDSVNVIGVTLRGHNSFPSGHSLTAFLYAGLVLPCLQSRVSRSLMLLMASMIALSRVMVGAHWPADIVAGSLGGLFCAWLSHLIVRKWRLGAGIVSQRLLMPLYLYAAYFLLDYPAGFKDMTWLGGLIGSSMLVFGTYYFIELVFFPERHYQRLKDVHAPASLTWPLKGGIRS